MSWSAKYIVLILFTTIVSYTAAILLERCKTQTAKKIILALTLLSCLGVLFTFKYFNFFSQTLSDFMKAFAINLHPVTLKFALPVGISFYTFQTLSYVIDVYRDKIAPEKNFVIYATFISFFPQLVAGPIERSENLLPQIKSCEKFSFDYDHASYGIKLTAWGLFKKLALADVLARYVDAVYSDLTGSLPLDLALAVFFFAIQIYCDFSGYSDIARGCAKMMGINLIENFKSPYFSSSIKEFWTRWHISLSTWFRDYLYIPLGGNRVSKFRHYVNIMITFIISGLWHGASWTFVIWGSIHGLAQIIENIFTRNKNTTSHGALRIIMTFIFCSFAWIFFRAETFNDSIYIFSKMFSFIFEPSLLLHRHIGPSKYELLIILPLVIILALYDYFSLKHDVINKISSMSLISRWVIYNVLTAGTFIIYARLAVTDASFIYFQF